MKKIGVYIHIPFCKQKCLYCDFISFAHKESMQEEYVQALKNEIRNWKEKNESTKIETIYIGGGTPSYLESKYIAEILEELQIEKLPNGNAIEQEITIEVNPGTITEQKLKEYKQTGINRISIGLQSTKNEILKIIGRIHTYNDFLETYKLVRKVGFENINVDLMIGLPNQTISDIKESLEELINLTPCKPEHISVYSLIVEEETAMCKLIDSGKLKLPDEELERNMYWYVKNFLELNNYKHYEISNFAKPGFESKHNIDCWSQKEYIGFGIAAHSYIDNIRFCNISDIEQYIKNCNEQSLKKNIIIQEKQEVTEKMKEFMLLGLRKIDGISIQNFKNIFNENPIMLFRNQLEKLYQEKLITIDGDNIRLSNKGLDLANLVWEEFV